MKTQSINEWLANGGTIKKVKIESTWKTVDLPASLRNAEKYQSNGGKSAKANNAVVRRSEQRRLNATP